MKLIPLSLLLIASAAHAAPSAPATPAIDCGQGVTLSIPQLTLRQGQLSSLRLKSPQALLDVQGQFATQKLESWPTGELEPKAGSTAQFERDAFLAVDLEQAPGPATLSLTGHTAGGASFSCTATITIAAGLFATESLKVSKQFVEPDPDQLARAAAEQKRLKAIYDLVSPEKLWSGAFRVPLDGVSTGGNFGKRRVLNGQPSSPHTGVDFPSPTGTPVHAAQSGKVVLAEELYFAGNTVLVDHGLGVYTLYGHLSAISVHVGDALQLGQIIGKIGATGRVTGPHLHWGLRVEGSRVNALDIVPPSAAKSHRASKVKKKRQTR